MLTICRISDGSYGVRRQRKGRCLIRPFWRRRFGFPRSGANRKGSPISAEPNVIPAGHPGDHQFYPDPNPQSAIPYGSVTVTSWLIGTWLSTWRRPLGQWISTESIRAAFPSPKVARSWD
jgi:hypothetical protein